MEWPLRSRRILRRRAAWEVWDTIGAMYRQFIGASHVFCGIRRTRRMKASRLRLQHPWIDIGLEPIVAPIEGLEIAEIAHPAEGTGKNVVDLPAVVGLQPMFVEAHPVAADILAEDVGIVAFDRSAFVPDVALHRRLDFQEGVSLIGHGIQIR